MADNPFPLEIQEKQDSWSRTQLLLNVASEFKLTATEFNKMIKGIEYNYINQGGVFNSLPPLQAPDYADVAAMYANQANQTQGYMQKVLDGPGDLLVTYYLYKGTLNGNASDYDQLTPEQASVFEGSMDWQIKRVQHKAGAYSNLSLNVGEIAVINASPKIAGFILDTEYSRIMKGSLDLFDLGEPILLSWMNATRKTNMITKIESYSYYQATNQLIINIETVGEYSLNSNRIAQNDIIHLLLPYTGSSSGGSGQSLFLGTYTSLPNLTAAHPSPLEGSKANIDDGVGDDVRRALWDNSDNVWILGGTIGGDMDSSTYDPAGKSEQVLTISDILDEDDMSSDSANKAPSQQSVKAYIDNLPIPTEEEIKGTKLTASVSGTYNIDLDPASDFHLTMTANTDFTFTNTPTGTEVRRCKIRLTGEFAPTLTQSGLNVFGDDYDGTKWNDVLVEIWLDGTIKGLLIYQQREDA